VEVILNLELHCDYHLHPVCPVQTVRQFRSEGCSIRGRANLGFQVRTERPWQLHVMAMVMVTTMADRTDIEGTGGTPDAFPAVMISQYFTRTDCNRKSSR
jgi:hypothetical protein